MNACANFSKRCGLFFCKLAFIDDQMSRNKGMEIIPFRIEVTFAVADLSLIADVDAFLRTSFIIN